VVSSSLAPQRAYYTSDSLYNSAASAYENDQWILDLVEYVKNLSNLNQSLKLLGLCFGHQIIARAFGSKTEKNEKGWEVGTRDIELTHTAKQLFTRVKLVSNQPVFYLALVFAALTYDFDYPVGASNASRSRSGAA
jgi:GMP synthase-like glutamine amidotransferase